MSRTRGGAPMVALAALALAGIGCGASGGSPGMSLFGKPLTTECGVVNDVERSRRCAAWFVDEMMLSAYGHYEDERLHAYVRSVGMRVVAVADPERRIERWTFRILDSPDVRAYAQLAGYVYVSRGALAVLASEAELAALLAHEIAHVAAGHGQVFWEGMARQLDRTPDDVHEHARDRDDERQADELAVSYLRQTDYDPVALLDMLERLSATDAHEREKAGAPPADEEPSWRDSHPPIGVRLARVALVMGADATGQRFRDRYMDRINDIVLGHDPRRGALEDTRYIHAAGALAFDPAPAWSLSMSGRELRGLNASGTLRLALSPVGDLHAVALLASLEKVESTRIGPFDARIGWYRGDDVGEGAVRRIAVLKARRHVFTLVVQGESRAAVTRALAEIGVALRRPRAAELATTAPMRMQLIEVPMRSSVGALAAKHCERADITLFLEGGDASSRRDRGDRLKCTR